LKRYRRRFRSISRTRSPACRPPGDSSGASAAGAGAVGGVSEFMSGPVGCGRSLDGAGSRARQFVWVSQRDLHALILAAGRVVPRLGCQPFSSSCAATGTLLGATAPRRFDRTDAAAAGASDLERAISDSGSIIGDDDSLTRCEAFAQKDLSSPSDPELSDYPEEQPGQEPEPGATQDASVEAELLHPSEEPRRRGFAPGHQ